MYTYDIVILQATDDYVWFGKILPEILPITLIAISLTLFLDTSVAGKWEQASANGKLFYAKCTYFANGSIPISIQIPYLDMT